MGITGLIPFIEKASRKANISEFNGCTVAIDSYCWLHKGAFACADKLVRGEETDVHIKYCLKYVSMLLSNNIKPIMVFDGRHLPAKAMTEAKRRESRTISKKRAAELLSLGKVEEARTYLRRCVDITHEMALSLIKECRKIGVDCIVAPYEADAQLAYLNMNNFAHLVITEDSDLILFGCTKVLFKMDLFGAGTLVETAKLPLVMKCPIEHFTFDKFRQMCIMSGCDYLQSLPGIGLAKARQFVTATQDSNFANALRKLPSFFNRSNLVVTDDYRENFLKAEATFKHQYVYDPIERRMVRLTDPEDEDIEQALCVNAGELLDSETAFQLALGNLDPFTLKRMDNWHPDADNVVKATKTNSWESKQHKHASIWSKQYTQFLNEECPWQKKKKQPILLATQTRPRKKIVNLVSKIVPETQDEGLSMETLSNMYCLEPSSKKQRLIAGDSEILHANTEDVLNDGLIEDDTHNLKHNGGQTNKSPILENKERSFRKTLRKCNLMTLKKLSRFPRTTIDENVVESKFFTPVSSIDNNTSDKNISKDSIVIEESPEKVSKNPFKIRPNERETSMEEIKEKSGKDSDEELDLSLKENFTNNSPIKCQSPILEPSPLHKKAIRLNVCKSESFYDLSEDSVMDNTYPLERLVTPVDSQSSFGSSTVQSQSSQYDNEKSRNLVTKSNKSPPNKSPRRGTLKRAISLPSNQPTLLSKFGFQKKPILKK